MKRFPIALGVLDELGERWRREETAEWNARVRVERVEVDASRDEVREVRVARFLFRE